MSIFQVIPNSADVTLAVGQTTKPASLDGCPMFASAQMVTGVARSDALAARATTAAKTKNRGAWSESI
jgi:hypothetical protein